MDYSKRSTEGQMSKDEEAIRAYSAFELHDNFLCESDKCEWCKRQCPSCRQFREPGASKCEVCGFEVTKMEWWNK